MKLLIALVFVFTLAADCQAQPEAPLESDRPDFTEGANPVEPGRVQLEGGYLFSYDDTSNNRTVIHEAPQLLLRGGLVKDLEYRIAWTGYTREEAYIKSRAEKEISQGGADLSLGIKHKMYEQTDYSPDISFIAELGIPTGAESLSSDEIVPVLKLIWAYEIDNRYSMAGNINFEGAIDENKRYLETSSSLAVSRSLTESWGIYFGVLRILSLKRRI